MVGLHLTLDSLGNSLSLSSWSNIWNITNKVLNEVGLYNYTHKNALTNTLAQFYTQNASNIFEGNKLTLEWMTLNMILLAAILDFSMKMISERQIEARIRILTMDLP